MTILIIGLGNPGAQYDQTRHNAGFLALDYLREKFGAPAFRPNQKFSADISETTLHKNKIIFAKPRTFMNESGKSVRSLLDYYKLDTSSLIIIHDDLDIVPGTLRTTGSSRSAGHNGIQNIIEAIGTQDFFRIRLGIGRPADIAGVCMSSHDYVLGRFSTEESAKLEALFEETEHIIRKRIAPAETFQK